MSNRRCSYCGQPGHTKPTCPTYKAWIEDRRAMRGDADWHVQNYDAKKRKKADSAKNRKCSYCREGGHTRRTCAALKADIETTREILVEFRRNWLNRLVEEGLGSGALVAVDVWGERRVYFVRSMVTRDVVWWNKPTRPAIGVKRQDLRDAIHRPGWYENSLAWPSATRRGVEHRGDRDPSLYGLLSGPSESQIRAQFTDAWLNGQDGSVEAAFKWSSRKGDRGALPVKAEFDWHMSRSRDYLTRVR